MIELSFSMTEVSFFELRKDAREDAKTQGRTQRRKGNAKTQRERKDAKEDAKTQRIQRALISIAS